jgi:LuxR family maltose regulon positive regulatory protein
MNLVRTKLSPPVESGDLIVRPRLSKRLGDIVRTRLVVLQAAAGYGKTSILSQWHQTLRQSGQTAGWLTMEPSDSDAMSMLTYVAGALAETDLRNDPDIQRIIGNDLYATENSILAGLVNVLERHAAPVFLFFDDVHMLAPAPLSALRRLIELAPAGTHFIVASRFMPDLHLARLRARDLLLELGTEELRFTTTEAQSFMEKINHTGLDVDTLAALEERTEGWIAGIKLAAIALRGGGIKYADLLTSFTGSRHAISNFFAEEVIGSLRQELRDFLLKTAMLDRLCPALCDAVTGNTNSRQLLDEIEASALFLLRLDDERHWYRYHQLFAQFLQRRLIDEHPGLDRELHARASIWFWDAGFHVEAIEHALSARDQERAAQLLELRCQDMTYAGKFRLVRKFTAQISSAVLSRYPRVLMTMAWLLTRNLRFEETRAMLDTARNRLAEMEAAKELTPEEMPALRHLLLHREMMLSAALDNPQKTEAQCNQLIDDFPDQRNSYLMGTIYAHLLYARREQYQLGDLERLHATAQGVLNRSEYDFASISVQASVGPSLAFAGKTDAAIRALEQGLDQAIRFGSRNSALTALPALPLSELMYESNDLERAERLIEDSLPFATEFGFVDQLMAGYITHARIRRARGDMPGAVKALDEIMAIAVERGLERMRLAVVGERIKHLIQDGQPDQAARYARSSGIPRASESVVPKANVTTADESVAVAWVRIAQSEDRISDAMAVVKQWRTFCAAHGAMRSLIRWDILLTQILFVNGDLKGAQRTLREAIGHASSSRMIRSFIDEGSSIYSLLVATYEVDIKVLHPTDAFAAELLAAFEKTGMNTTVRSAARAPAEGLYGKLSAKEREVLILVSSGMRNREVAQKLGLTEGCVKWYMQQVYDKVGTRRRLQAVERARQFGLIA